MPPRTTEETAGLSRYKSGVSDEWGTLYALTTYVVRSSRVAQRLKNKDNVTKVQDG